MKNKIFIFTGAGISAESGLSTFRGEDGIWNNYDLNKVCNYNYLSSNVRNNEIRKEIFSFYQNLYELVCKAKPNKAHDVCYEIQQKYGIENVVIMTTNVDDLHEKSGAKNVLHLHGSINEMLCIACANIWAIKKIDFQERCPKCNSRVTKPNVVFFGEYAPNYKKLYSFLHPKNTNDKDILLVIGSSLEVISVDKLIRTDRYHTKRTENILINKEKTDFDHYFKHHLIGNATEKIEEAKELIEKLKEKINV